MTYAGERWRGFKVQLATQYIRGKYKDQSPCEHYPFIDEETWTKFVEKQLDPAFQVS